MTILINILLVGFGYLFLYYREQQSIRLSECRREANNYADKLKYDEIQIEIVKKIEIIEEAIIHVIQSKVVELNICNWNKPITLWNYNISKINNFKEFVQLLAKLLY